MNKQATIGSPSLDDPSCTCPVELDHGHLHCGGARSSLLRDVAGLPQNPVVYLRGVEHPRTHTYIHAWCMYIYIYIYYYIYMYIIIYIYYNIYIYKWIYIYTYIYINVIRISTLHMWVRKVTSEPSVFFNVLHITYTTRLISKKNAHELVLFDMRDILRSSADGQRGKSPQPSKSIAPKGHVFLPHLV